MKLKERFLKIFKSSFTGCILGGAAIASMFSSCGLVREDLEPCPDYDVELRFIYDYNMNRANAFHTQVHCLSVYFFDAEGKLIDIETVTDTDLLADENYRMHPDLPAGDYHVVAYGGMDCNDASFYRVGNFPEGSHYTNLRVQMDPMCLSDSEKHRLHNHYYGSLDFTVSKDADTRATVPMMRNTNSIQIVLQNEYIEQPIDHNDYTFEITDDNNDFSFDNSLIPTGEITYKPWVKENRSAFTAPADGSEAPEENFYAAVAQFTTSRLMLSGKDKPTSTRLTIRKVSDGQTVLSVPLVNYMMMFKHDSNGAGLDQMGDQEYLDRENNWNFVFFLKDGLWLESHIIINDWEVRMNHSEL